MKKLMRLESVFLFCLLLLYLPAIAQLKADAGEDLIVCTPDDGEYVMGGSPTASGGVEPYTYTWSGSLLDPDIPSNYWINASDILNDTTISNPTVKFENIPLEWFTLFLKVEDAMGETAYDSVKIVDGSIWIQTIYIGPDTIFRGDSVQLIGNPYFNNNFVPLTFLISPSYGLSDSTDVYGWAKPEYSITYYIQATNSLGCSSEKAKYWHIEVIDTTINSVQNSEFINFGLRFYPNPAKNQVNFTNPFGTKIKKIELIDFSGRIVQTWETMELTGKTLNLKNVLPGIYLIKAETEKGTQSEKIIIQ